MFTKWCFVVKSKRLRFVSENGAHAVKKSKLFASDKSNEADASTSDTLTSECETPPMLANGRESASNKSLDWNERMEMLKIFCVI